MISKVQSKRYTPQPKLSENASLTPLEKGLLRWTVAERGDKVLDVHVGNGLMLEYLQRNMECEVCGVSDDMESVRISRSRLRNADIVYASQEEIPWMEDTFDSVYMKLSGHAITEQMMHEAARVLKPGGQLLIGFRTVPAPLRILMSAMKSDSDDELARPTARARVLDLMQKNGFRQITSQRTGMINSVSIAWKSLETTP